MTEGMITASVAQQLRALNAKGSSHNERLAEAHELARLLLPPPLSNGVSPQETRLPALVRAHYLRSLTDWALSAVLRPQGGARRGTIHCHSLSVIHSVHPSLHPYCCGAPIYGMLLIFDCSRYLSCTSAFGLKIVLSVIRLYHFLTKCVGCFSGIGFLGFIPLNTKNSTF